MSGRSNNAECGVCLGPFDLGPHVPKSLRCNHTFCESCVGSLPGGTTISCPTCRRDCERGDIGTNYALTEILESSLCRICGDREKAALCHHCDKDVCAVCLEVHSIQFNRDFAGKLETLTEIMKDSLPLTFDSTVVRQENQKEQSIIAEITETFDRRRQALDEMEGELIQEVRRRASDNTERQTYWTQQLDATATRVREFVLSAEGPHTHVTPERKELDFQCQDLQAELDQIVNSQPRREDFNFEKTAEHLVTPRIGRIVVYDSGSRPQVVKSPTSRSQSTFSVISPAIPQRRPNVSVTPTSLHPVIPPVVPATSLQTGASPTTSSVRPPVVPARSLQTGASPTTSSVRPPVVPARSLQTGASPTTSSVRPPVVPTTPLQTGTSQTTPGRDTVSAYRLMSYKSMTGSQGQGAEHFNEPHHVTCDEERIYVSDYNNHRIKVYDHSLRLVGTYGSEGSGGHHLNSPAGVAISRNGKLFVADLKNHRIKVYDKHGKVTKIIGKQGDGRVKFDGPLGIAVGPDGDLYVSDSGNHRVQVLGPKGTFVRYIGEKGSGPGQFQELVRDVTVTSNRVIVRESKNKHLHVFTLPGEFLEMWPKGLPDALKDVSMNAVNSDRHDNTIVSYSTGCLVVLDPEGQYICTIGSRGAQPGEFRGPAGVAVNEAGDWIVCDTLNHRIQVFSSRI